MFRITKSEVVPISDMPLNELFWYSMYSMVDYGLIGRGLALGGVKH